MPETVERTLIMIKPDGMKRGLVGAIIERFERKGFKLQALKLVWPRESDQMFHRHYNDLAGEDFFPGLVKYMSSGPVVTMVWEGVNAVKSGRAMLGNSTTPGTIRGDYCTKWNGGHGVVIHGSDSVEAATKEINLWFTKNEIITLDYS